MAQLRSVGETTESISSATRRWRPGTPEVRRAEIWPTGQEGRTESGARGFRPGDPVAVRSPTVDRGSAGLWSEAVTQNDAVTQNVGIRHADDTASISWSVGHLTLLHLDMWICTCKDVGMTDTTQTPHVHEHAHGDETHTHAHVEHSHDHVEHEHEHTHGAEAHAHTHVHEAGLEDVHDGA